MRDWDEEGFEIIENRRFSLLPEVKGGGKKTIKIRRKTIGMGIWEKLPVEIREGRDRLVGMSNGKDFSEVVELIRREDPRYEKGAYYFVRQALDHTLKSIDEADEDREGHHVSGQELLEGIRKFALEQYGPMTKTLFDNWNIQECSDFGEIVFNLVEYGVLGKTDNDRPEDFADGYDFKEAFETPFLPKSGWRPTNRLFGELDDSRN